ncbi:ABC transporter ATP-binding protein [Chromatiales bacterium (ex Bugula neritina AB1)]|nr:ABC transporter ATP-binding protein [Chromatiales bacterium (ex Bugula neritina AB1)]
MSTNTVLEATGIVAGYRPDLPILHGVELQVNQGEIVTIIGPNGAGKSTFVKAVAGLVTVTAGSIRLNGREITHRKSHQLAADGVGFVPQTGNVFTTLSIHENLILGGITLPARKAATRIAELYKQYPVLKQRQFEKAGVLSGGQRQILAVARALLTTPKLILLDEPTAGLSPMAATELFTVVKQLVAEGASVLMVEQNARAALRISDRGYVLAEGQNRAEGAAEALLQDNDIREIFLGMRSAQIQTQETH